VEAAVSDLTCKTEYPEIPKYHKIVVPKIRCYKEDKQVETNNTLQTERWKMQLNVLTSANECSRINCLEIDKELIKVPSDLVKSIEAMTFDMHPDVVQHVKNAAGFIYDEQIRNKSMLGQFRRTKKFTAQRHKDRKIVEKQNEARENLIAGASVKAEALRTFFHTEYELREARKTNDHRRVRDLEDQQPDQVAQVATALHLNTNSSKSRAGVKRKARSAKSTKKPAAQQQNPAVQVQGKKGHVKVSVSISGGAKAKRQPQQSHKKQPNKKQRGGNRGRGSSHGRGRG
jgi:hypothetical protein